jgi:hypothetical protein
MSLLCALRVAKLCYFRVKGIFACVRFLCVTPYPIDVDISRLGSFAMASASEIRFIGMNFTRIFEFSNMAFIKLSRTSDVLYMSELSKW